MITAKKILFVSGSIGLGHIVRDLAIARELRRQDARVEISWLSGTPASMLLEEAGEKLLPEARQYADDNIPAEHAAKGYRLNVLTYLMKARRDWAQNAEVFKQVIRKEGFDVVVGDEAYEANIALMEDPGLLKAPYVMIFDFVGLDAMTGSPLEKPGVYMWNRAWVKTKVLFTKRKSLGLLIGELEDVPDKSFGFLLPNRREFARAYYHTIGYVLPFDPANHADKTQIRAKLGYGEEPLVICAIGGTAIGKDLLELCGQAYSLIREKIPGLRMALVCGPRLTPESLKVPEGVEVRGYVPALYEHFAASDLAVVQAGGTSTLELAALRRPFLYFPLEGHFEQELYVSGTLARHRAGIRMAFSETTPNSLADAVVANMGKEVDYAPIPADGAQQAARLILEFAGIIDR